MTMPSGPPPGSATALDAWAGAVGPVTAGFSCAGELHATSTAREASRMRKTLARIADADHDESRKLSRFILRSCPSR